MAAKWRWRAKREAEGKPTDKPNMVCGPVQVVWHKFAKYWDIEMREIPMSPGQVLHGRGADAGPSRREHHHGGAHLRGDLHGFLRAGPRALPQALDKLPSDTGLDIDIHVDGASGAFLAPFCAPDVVWDFRIPRVKSISTSGHKFGLAPLGVGLGAVAGQGGPARRPHLPRHLSGRGHARLPDQLLPAGRPDRGPVLQLRPPGEEGLPGRPRRLLRHGQVPGRGDRQTRAVRHPVRRQPADRDPLGGLADHRGAGSRATPSTTSPTGSGCRGGRCRPTR